MKRILLVAMLLSTQLAYGALAEYTDANSMISQYETLLGCEKDGKRIRKEYHFSPVLLGTPFRGAATQQASYKEGLIEGMSTDKLFFGKSTWGDLLVVQTLTNQDQGSGGTNIYLSFCEYRHLLMPGREISHFQAPFGMSALQDVDACLQGDLVATTTIVIAEQAGVLPEVLVHTTFSPLSSQQKLSICTGIVKRAVRDGARSNGEDNSINVSAIRENPSIAVPR